MLTVNKLLEKTKLDSIDYNEIISEIFIVGLKILLIVILTFITIKIVNRLCKKIFSNNMVDVVFNEKDNKTLESAVRGVMKAVIIFIAFSSVMSIFGINMTSVLAVAGVGSLAIGFAAQGLVRDVLTGGFILLENQYNIGDLIEVNGILGTVEELTMRITKIRSFNGSLHIIPNGEIKMVTSMSKDYTRAIVNIGVAYNEDIGRVTKIIEDELLDVDEKVENLIEKPQILGISEFAENYINILIVAPCRAATHFAVERDIRLIVRKAFEREGITPPISQNITNLREDKNGL